MKNNEPHFMPESEYQSLVDAYFDKAYEDLCKHEPFFKAKQFLKKWTVYFINPVTLTLMYFVWTGIH